MISIRVYLCEQLYDRVNKYLRLVEGVSAFGHDVFWVSTFQLLNTLGRIRRLSKNFDFLLFSIFCDKWKSKSGWFARNEKTENYKGVKVGAREVWEALESINFFLVWGARGVFGPDLTSRAQQVTQIQPKNDLRRAILDFSRSKIDRFFSTKEIFVDLKGEKI